MENKKKVAPRRKSCRKCKKWQDLTNYSRLKFSQIKRGHGFSSVCKSCKNKNKSNKSCEI